MKTWNWIIEGGSCVSFLYIQLICVMSCSIKLNEILSHLFALFHFHFEEKKKVKEEVVVLFNGKEKKEFQSLSTKLDFSAPLQKTFGKSRKRGRKKKNKFKKLIRLKLDKFVKTQRERESGFNLKEY